MWLWVAAIADMKPYLPPKYSKTHKYLSLSLVYKNTTSLRMIFDLSVITLQFRIFINSYLMNLNFSTNSSMTLVVNYF